MLFVHIVGNIGAQRAPHKKSPTLYNIIVLYYINCVIFCVYNSIRKYFFFKPLLHWCCKEKNSDEQKTIDASFLRVVRTRVRLGENETKEKSMKMLLVADGNKDNNTHTHTNILSCGGNVYF